MNLTHLSLTNFRAFTRLDMDVPRRVLVLVGDNAQGKTTVLEAIYYLATFTSLQAQNDRQLINFLSLNDALPVTRLVADFTRAGRNHRLEARLILDPNGNGGRLRKEILLDGVKRSAHEALGVFNAVIFLPQMTRIVEGGPDERRRYLNLALSQAVPGYARALAEYAQVVTQRNALLKQLNERGGDPDQLVYWDDLLTRRGSLIIHARLLAVQQIEQLAARIHDHLTRGQEVLRLSYQPSFDPAPAPNGQYSLPIETPKLPAALTVDEICTVFAARLQASRREEIARGVTTLGPHRDELRFMSNRIDLGDYGSRGQVRTLLLSLKLAELAWLRARTQEWPVLLLDEIMAELDIQRRADLLSYLSGLEQAILTTTDLNLFQESFVQHTTVWQVQAGTIESGGTIPSNPPQTAAG